MNNVTLQHKELEYKQTKPKSGRRKKIIEKNYKSLKPKVVSSHTHTKINRPSARWTKIKRENANYKN